MGCTSRQSFSYIFFDCSDVGFNATSLFGGGIPNLISYGMDPFPCRRSHPMDQKVFFES